MSEPRERRQPRGPVDEAIGPVIRLESDYMCGVPLWGRDGCLNGPHSGPSVSPQLHDDLVAWQDDFESHFDHRNGWDSPSSAMDYAAAGRRLAKRLRSELPAYDIILNLWPVPEGLLHQR